MDPNAYHQHMAGQLPGLTAAAQYNPNFYAQAMQGQVTANSYMQGANGYNMTMAQMAPYASHNMSPTPQGGHSSQGIKRENGSPVNQPPQAAPAHTGPSKSPYPPPHSAHGQQPTQNVGEMRDFISMYLPQNQESHLNNAQHRMHQLQQQYNGHHLPPTSSESTTCRP